MAGKNVELGTVGFNLESHDESLDQSLIKLRKFGDAVTKASNLNDEAGQKHYRTITQVERVLTSAFDKVSALTQGLKKIDETGAAVEKLTSQYNALVTALTKAGGGAETHEFVRAQVGLGAATAQANRSIKERESLLSLEQAKTTALVNTWERYSNVMSRMRLRGANEGHLQGYATAIDQFQTSVNKADVSVTDLKDAQRGFNQAMGETTRLIRENLAQQSLAEKQQSKLIAATRNVAYLNARVTRSGLPFSQINENNAALQGFGTALQGGNQQQIISAQQKLNDVMMNTRIAMAGAEKPASRMSIAMHDISKASVLALGPLSGVGARISIMTSLLESNTVATALFIGGVVAATAVLYKLSSASIKATMDQQKFDALLLTSTGSALLAEKEYRYLYETANKLGAGVRGLVKPYADFASAARLSGMGVETQRKIFEAMITTSAALRWNQEQTGRAFLAVTQMISKTTVMSEEMKKQLGELIPNVIGLGAAAEGVGTKAYMKMMQSGELLTNSHLPKLAAMMQKVFGPGAEKGADTLAAKLEILGNSVFELLKAFDKATKFSDAVRASIILLTQVTEFLRINMVSLVGAFVALAGAGAGLAVVALFSNLPTAVMATVAAVRALTIGVTGLRAAAILLESSTLIGWVLKLGAAIVGAAAGWMFYKQAADAAAGSQANINSRVKEWIDQQSKIGSTQKQVRDQMLSEAGERLGVLQKQLSDEEKVLKQLEEAHKPKVKKAAPFGIQHNAFATSSGTYIDPEVAKAQKRVTDLRTQLEELRALTVQAAGMKIDPPIIAGGSDDDEKGMGAWKSWVKKISKHIEDVKGKMGELNALSTGDHAGQQLAKALSNANELMLEMPKKSGSLKIVADNLRAAGYEGKTVVEQLTAMFLAEEKATEGIRDFGKAAKEQKSAVKELSDMWDDLRNRDEAITGNVAGFDAEQAKQAKRLLTDMDKMKEKLKAIGMSEEGMAAALGAYRSEWTRVSGAESHQKEVEKVTAELDRMGVKIGDTATRLAAAANKQIEIVNRAAQLGIISHATAAEEIIKINDDLYRKLTERTSEYHDFLQGIMESVESGLVKAFSGGDEDILKNFEKLLKGLWAQIVAFMVKTAIIKPMMTAMFGEDFSGNKGDGKGLFGNALLKIGMFIGAGAGAGNTEPAGGNIYDPWNNGGNRATGGGVNPFTDYVVGESGVEVLRLGKNGGSVISSANARQMSSGGMHYEDKSKTVNYIDSRTDSAFIAQMIARTQAQNNRIIQRQLKVRYG